MMTSASFANPMHANTILSKSFGKYIFISTAKSIALKTDLKQGQPKKGWWALVQPNWRELFITLCVHGPLIRHFLGNSSYRNFSHTWQNSKSLKLILMDSFQASSFVSNSFNLYHTIVQSHLKCVTYQRVFGWIHCNVAVLFQYYLGCKVPILQFLLKTYLLIVRKTV